MALINEHVVKSEILATLSELFDKYSYEYFVDSCMSGDSIIVVDSNNFNNIINDLSEKLDKLLK